MSPQEVAFRDGQAPAPKVSVTRTWLAAMQRAADLTADPGHCLGAELDALALRHGDRAAILDEGRVLTFSDLASLCRRYARWAQALGLKRGEVVGLLSPNRADYLAAWAGASRSGVTVALLNPQLPPEGLAHSLRTSGAAHVLVDPRCAGLLDAAAETLPSPPRVWDFEAAAAAQDDAPFAAGYLDGLVRAHDRALLIFTSGTTGWPKAANVSHARVLAWAGWFSGVMGVREDDRLYDCLPMHHSVGGVAAIGGALVAGASVVVRERFSASRFWADVAETGATLFQYIGELCRYLLAAPPSPGERDHRLRLACGNGLGASVWGAFQARFAVPRVLEFYAATEGSFSLYNVEGRPGAIGRVPGFLRHRFPAAIVRHDPATGLPARDGDGRCLRCDADEPGEAIGRIALPGPTLAGSGQPFARFEGYTEAGASEAKVLRDVFEPGDAWFRTGDLMARDADGFFRFVDRLGDTFRWKGENVSTAEVADALGGAAGVTGAVVWGVALPGCEGRAGMAALAVSADFDLDAFARHAARRLAPYARPVLLRLMRELATTSTFKPRTQALAAEGFNPAVVTDPLYLLEDGAYRPLDPARHARLMAGRMRL